MTTTIAPDNGESTLILKDLELIADQVVDWSRQQAKAFSQMPLAYIERLLDRMADAEYVAWEDIPQELGKLVPYLKPDDCLPWSASTSIDDPCQPDAPLAPLVSRWRSDTSKNLEEGSLCLSKPKLGRRFRTRFTKK